MKYTVDYFIKKFKAIPRSKWTTGVYFNKNEQFCALGHCGATYDYSMTRENKTREGNALLKLFRENLYEDAYFVNDGKSSSYKQVTPKGRILAALNDIKKRK